MGDLSEHFDRVEFACKCGCGKNNVAPELIEGLEQIIDYLSKCEHGFAACIITSGCRCPSHSVKVGGSANDPHTKSMAADCYFLGADRTPYPAEMVAAVAELYKFGGIGIIDGHCIHLDRRDVLPYVNKHWYGDERTGNNYVPTWAAHLPAAKIINKHKISVFYDGKKISESEV